MRFSIIIPTHNRQEHLNKCLDAMSRLRYPAREFEVIVVDDGSDPPAAKTCATFETIRNLRHLRLRQGGPAKARNAGLAAARGEYVVFTDDDCAPDPDWLQAYDRVFEAAPDAGVGGSIVDAVQNNIFGRTSQLLVRFLYSETGSFLPRFFCSNNLAFPRLRLAALYGFDEGFPLAAGEDRDLCHRWAKHHDLVYAASAVTVHHQDLGLAGFLRQHFRYGRGAFHFWQRCAVWGESRRTAPFDFYARMLLFPFTEFRAPKSFGAAALIVLSQVANAAGYFDEKWRRPSAMPQRKGPASAQAPIPQAGSLESLSGSRKTF